jgi:hypothetical protein
MVTHDGRSWLAVIDGDGASGDLRLWELSSEGAVIAGPVVVESGLQPTAPFNPPAIWAAANLRLAATDWGLVASWLNGDDAVPPTGAAEVANIEVRHLAFDMTLASPPITIPILDPAQDSPPRTAFTTSPPGLLAVWAGRGLYPDEVVDQRVFMARLICHER